MNKKLNSINKLITSWIKKQRLPIASVIAFGSRTRNLRVDKQSDLDLIFILENEAIINHDFIEKFKKLVMLVEKKSEIKISPNVMKEAEFLYIYSPLFLEDLADNSVEVFGNQFKKVLQKAGQMFTSQKVKDAYAARRILFLIYGLREKILLQNYTPSILARELNKKTYYLLRDLFYLVSSNLSNNLKLSADSPVDLRIQKIWRATLAAQPKSSVPIEKHLAYFNLIYLNSLAILKVKYKKFTLPFYF